MPLTHRFIVEGYDGNHGFVKRSFKDRKSALRLAAKLLDVEVYDSKEKNYIFGTTAFVKAFVQAEREKYGRGRYSSIGERDERGNFVSKEKRVL
jgi:hypothetical protein